MAKYSHTYRELQVNKERPLTWFIRYIYYWNYS